MGNKVLQGEKDKPFLGILASAGVWLCEEENSKSMREAEMSRDQIES